MYILVGGAIRGGFGVCGGWFRYLKLLHRGVNSTFSSGPDLQVPGRWALGSGRSTLFFDILSCMICLPGRRALGSGHPTFANLSEACRGAGRWAAGDQLNVLISGPKSKDSTGAGAVPGTHLDATVPLRVCARVSHASHVGLAAGGVARMARRFQRGGGGDGGGRVEGARGFGLIGEI